MGKLFHLKTETTFPFEIKFSPKNKEIIEEFFGKNSAKEEEEMEYYVKNLSDVEERTVEESNLKRKESFLFRK